MLFQLSYEPQTAGAVGFVACFREAVPTTFEVEARHSIQLSYAPMFFVNVRSHFAYKLSEHCVF